MKRCLLSLILLVVFLTPASSNMFDPYIKKCRTGCDTFAYTSPEALMKALRFSFTEQSFASRLRLDINNDVATIITAGFPVYVVEFGEEISKVRTGSRIWYLPTMVLDCD